MLNILYYLKGNIMFVKFKYVESDSSFQQVITKGPLFARQWARSWDDSSEQDQVPALNELTVW